MHHTNAIAEMISSSLGICDRGDGIAPGGRGRQRRMSGVGGVGKDVECTAFEDGLLLVGVWNPLVDS